MITLQVNICKHFTGNIKQYEKCIHAIDAMQKTKGGAYRFAQSRPARSADFWILSQASERGVFIIRRSD